MNSLLQNLHSNPSDNTAIFKIESEIKKNWKYYCPSDAFNQLVFNESFSELLLELTKKKITKKHEFQRLFLNIYKKYSNSFSKLLIYDENRVDVTITKSPILDLSELSNSDVLLLFKYISDPDKIKNERIIKILSKVKLNPDFSDEEVLKLISGLNFSSVYLISKLGIKGYKEYIDLINKLGIYYPLSELPDDEIVSSVKTKLIDNFVANIDNFNSIKLLEKLLY